MTGYTDETLMSRFACGDRAAFGELERRWTPKLTLLLSRKRSGCEHSDVVQEAWAKVIRGAATYDTSCPFCKWVITITLNTLRDMIRRQVRCRRVGLNTPTTGSWARAQVVNDDESGMAERLPAPDRVCPVERGEDISRMLGLVDTLPETQRLLVRRAYMEETKWQDIARETGLPLGTVKSRISAALRALREKMEVADVI